MSSLKKKWNITSNFQFVLIFIVFAVTGSTSAYIAKPILSFLGINKSDFSAWLYYPLYIILIFPIYQVLLLFFGTIFGQFKFFFEIEKKFLSRVGLGFLFSKKSSK
ncbi:DUF6787 family protein [Flavobacterium croceum]|jgi:hypothetical protein|uniref:DUF6787 family protein n=1 Tax=Flavobacterium croceum TaxID=370975 RepID=UPI0024A82BDF|nr:DUF6787 family protein [Flavobacterium croceum]